MNPQHPFPMQRPPVTMTLHGRAMKPHPVGVGIQPRYPLLRYQYPSYHYPNHVPQSQYPVGGKEATEGKSCAVKRPAGKNLVTKKLKKPRIVTLPQEGEWQKLAASIQALNVATARDNDV
jgi:hypothetical protein